MIEMLLSFARFQIYLCVIAEFDALVSLQPALCGTKKEIEDQYDLNSKVQGAQSEQDAKEEAQLNGMERVYLHERSVDRLEEMIIWGGGKWGWGGGHKYSFWSLRK